MVMEYNINICLYDQEWGRAISEQAVYQESPKFLLIRIRRLIASEFFFFVFFNFVCLIYQTSLEDNIYSCSI